MPYFTYVIAFFFTIFIYSADLFAFGIQRTQYYNGRSDTFQSRDWFSVSNILIYPFNMRLIDLLLAVLFAFATTSCAWPEANIPTLQARKNGNNTRTDNSGQSLKKTCKKMRKLNMLTALAANQTKLDEWVARGMLTAAKADKIKEKASKATTKLESLQSNSTLVSQCAVVNAEIEINKQCKQMGTLTKLAALAHNETAMAEFETRRGLNEKLIEKLREKIQDASKTLKKMQANTTLADFCKQKQQQKDAAGTGTSKVLRV
jgi:hypothetical protein